MKRTENDIFFFCFLRGKRERNKKKKEKTKQKKNKKKQCANNFASERNESVQKEHKTKFLSQNNLVIKINNNFEVISRLIESTSICSAPKISSQAIFLKARFSERQPDKILVLFGRVDVKDKTVVQLVDAQVQVPGSAFRSPWAPCQRALAKKHSGRHPR